jgi:hypothetical protein
MLRAAESAQQCLAGRTEHLGRRLSIAGLGCLGARKLTTYDLYEYD